MGGFDLSKWKANHPDLLDKNDDGSPGEIEDKIIKILGVHWNPKEDVFRFTMDVFRPKLLVNSSACNAASSTPRALLLPSSFWAKNLSNYP